MLPCVLGVGLAAVLAALGGIAAPADVELGDGVVDKGEVVAGELVGGEDEFVIQQGDEFVGFKAAVHQGEGLREGIQQGLAVGDLGVGQGIGQGVGAMFAEDGFYIGGVGFYVGGEDGDVVRLPIRVLGKQHEQLVFEDLQFAQGAVRAVDLDAGVGVELGEGEILLVGELDLSDGVLLGCEAA